MAPHAASNQSAAASSGNVFDLLETLPRLSLDRLYGQAGGKTSPYPWTCRAVFQSLPPLAKQYIMRLLCIDNDISRQSMRQWVNPQHTDSHNRALRKLDRLRILLELDDSSDKLQLNPYFRANLRAALTNQLTEPWSAPSFVLKPETDVPTAQQLESFMCSSWDGVLYYMVGAVASDGAQYAEPAEEVKRFLLETGLMKESPFTGTVMDAGDDGDDNDDARQQLLKMQRRRAMNITNKGITFLLMDVHIQVWRFVEYCISHDGGSRDDILTFLFQLSFCQVGKSYPTDALTPAQMTLLRKFEDLGLIYRKSALADRFYPTDVAVNLIFGASAQRHVEVGASATESRPVDPKQLSIIVETNYQVVAYTSSTLHMEMLRLFTDVRCRLPNVVIARLTRDSVRRALESGISARSIISFLKNHAHPEVRKRKDKLEKAKRDGRLLPQNVEDQIHLWHQERERVQYDDAVLYELTRLGDRDFADVRKYAEDLQVLHWGSPPGDTRKLLIVDAEGLQTLRSFVESRTAAVS